MALDFLCCLVGAFIFGMALAVADRMREREKERKAQGK
jgi:hypothetical protein